MLTNQALAEAVAALADSASPSVHDLAEFADAAAAQPAGQLTDRVRQAIRVAAVGHAGQVTRDGSPYLLHPLHVMNAVAHLGESPMVVAVLHDYLEDCELDEAAIGFLSAEERDALERLTHRKGDEYLGAYLERILDSPLARTVKRADLRHNLDLSRRDLTIELTQKDLDRCNRYREALRRVEAAEAAAGTSF